MLLNSKTQSAGRIVFLKCADRFELSIAWDKSLSVRQQILQFVISRLLLNLLWLIVTHYLTGLF
ncbi:MAG: hypothetical protein WBB29_20665 [Geitlerinemataceae cyanobacterium]